MVPPRQPFDIVRGVFWLIAIVILFALTVAGSVGALCAYIIVFKGAGFGDCKGFDLRGLWSEVMTVIGVVEYARLPPPRPPEPREPPP